MKKRVYSGKWIKKDREKWSPGGKTMVKVFLVEDEVIIGTVYGIILTGRATDLNLRGRRATASTAYPLILKAQPDILVTDIKMPFMDGLELSRLVKKGASAHADHRAQRLQ